MPQPDRTFDRLAGRVAIVTGGGTEDMVGIGSATALLIAAEGARLAVVDIDQGRAERTVADIGAAGGEAVAIVADVGDVADCARAVEQTVAAFGGVDILVNNVGINPSNPLTGFDAEVY